MSASGRVSALALAAALAGGLGSPATPAQRADQREGDAAVLQCGSTVRKDTKLHQSLRNCPGTGLVVRADNVTIDLNGFTIDSAGSGDAVGLDINSRRNVHVQNGTIRDFPTGVAVIDSSRVRLSRLTLVDNSLFGVLLVRSDRDRIEQSRAFHTTADHGNAAILLFQSDHNRIQQNTLTRNGDGINLVQSTHNAILQNVSSRSGAGIGLVDHSHRNLIALNTTDGNVDTGILLDVHDDRNVIRFNEARANQFAGIAVGASDHNQVAHNVTDGNFGSGIAILDDAVGTVVEHNSANRNGSAPFDCQPLCPTLDDGIHVDAPRTFLGDNVANHNTDLGIQAVKGIVDEGGNEARANGDPSQCRGVICVSGRP